MTLDRDMLTDVGFKLVPTFPGETWVYGNGTCWVHFYEIPPPGKLFQQIDARSISRKEFFEWFIKVLKRDVQDTAYVCFSTEDDN